MGVFFMALRKTVKYSFIMNLSLNNNLKNSRHEISKIYYQKKC
jgi:hypothetical protein